VGEAEAQTQLIKKYTDANPNVEIELYQTGWGGYHEKLLTMAAGGIAPDIMILSRLQMPAFADSGVIQPIDTWYAKESPEFRRDIMEVVSGTYNRKLYGIPIWGGPTVLEYNADRFDNIGAAQPSDLAKKKAWTWDRFVEFGRKITQDSNGDGTRDVFMHARIGTRAADWYIKLRGFGADVIKQDGKAFTDVNTMEKGLQFWSDLAWQSHIAPTGKEASSFTKGTEAMYFTWISDAPNHYKTVNKSFRVELTTPPTGPAGLFTLVGGCPITISATTPNAYEAYKFAKWYAMESDHWKIRGTPPSMTDMRRDYRSYLATMYSWPDAVVEAMAGQVAMEPGVGKYFNDFNKAWNESLGAVAGGSMAPREGAIRMVEATQRILGEAK
jgi:multiple sugar transport system substrate-binding protein